MDPKTLTGEQLLFRYDAAHADIGAARNSHERDAARESWMPLHGELLRRLELLEEKTT